MDFTGILATAGIKLGGWALGELFGGEEQQLAPMQVGANISRYAAELQDVLGGRREEAFGVARRESARSGTALGGAYLENVVQIEQQINDIFGREVSQFEMQQMGMQSQWSQEQAKVRYAEGVQRRQGRQAMIGDIVGGIAAYPFMQAQERKQQARWDEIKAMIPQTPEVQPTSGNIDLFNQWIMAQTMMSGSTNPKIWSDRMMEIEKTIINNGMGNQFNPQPIWTGSSEYRG